MPIKLAISASHSIQFPSQPVAALTQNTDAACSRVVSRMSVYFSHEPVTLETNTLPLDLNHKHAPVVEGRM